MSTLQALFGYYDSERESPGKIMDLDGKTPNWMLGNPRAMAIGEYAQVGGFVGKRDGKQHGVPGMLRNIVGFGECSSEEEEEGKCVVHFRKERVGGEMQATEHRPVVGKIRIAGGS